MSCSVFVTASTRRWGSIDLRQKDRSFYLDDNALGLLAPAPTVVAHREGAAPRCVVQPITDYSCRENTAALLSNQKALLVPRP
ncbi:hypothetical protein GCM10010441_06320 [Kitasatospora paracochleata]|uniref:Uncharacterized protein n=1 Tax=Kitasatospora paracochleata TaxID=58354 RepID=A0ABT1IWN0_9ACTN|nr:hypothetical protein [Kitasatospora paracochleata]